MAFDYSGLVETALELIDDFGRSVTLTKKGATSTTPGKPWEGGTDDDPTEVPVSAVFTEIGDTFRDDDRVRSTDQLCLIAASALGAVEPVSGDKITDEGKVHAVVAVKPIKPGPVGIVFMIAARA